MSVLRMFAQLLQDSHSYSSGWSPANLRIVTNISQNIFVTLIFRHRGGKWLITMATSFINILANYFFIRKTSALPLELSAMRISNWTLRSAWYPVKGSMRMFTLNIWISAKKKTWNNLKSSWETTKNIKEDISMISVILPQSKVGKRAARFKFQGFSLC